MVIHPCCILGDNNQPSAEEERKKERKNIIISGIAQIANALGTLATADRDKKIICKNAVLNIIFGAMTIALGGTRSFLENEQFVLDPEMIDEIYELIQQEINNRIVPASS